jgi:hypothetical protein
VQTIPFDPTLLGTGKIFPPAIESMDWIGYHATSSYYSADIDTNGFLLKKPLPNGDLERLVSIAVAHGEDASDVSDFIRLASVSFTPISELALFFARPESFGGQGLLHVTRIMDALIQRKAAQLSEDETSHLQDLSERIALIRAAPPVIYAVTLAGLERTIFGKHTLAYHAYVPVPAERLLAKMMIDQVVDCSRLDIKGHNKSLRMILQSPGSHYLKQIAS